MTTSRRVALLVETSTEYGRSLLHGIIRYMRRHEEWSVFLEERDLTSELPAWLQDWRGDGIISRVTNQWLLDVVARSSVPLINLTDRTEIAGIPTVTSDQQLIGRIGAEHLLDRGFKCFGYCGFAGEAWSQGRREGFEERLREAQQDWQVYESAWLGAQARKWQDEQRELCSWLNSLPKPCAIMACSDVRAQRLLDACRTCNLAVPEEIAVIGVDNDKLLCELCSPPLTSVIPNTEQIGYLGAEQLDRRMHNQPLESLTTRVPPLGVATRQSTDSVAIDDPEMASAVRYIREHACQGTSVDEVLRHVTMSRSALERGFRKYLRRSPQQEIRNVQLKRCQTLLQETDLPMERIATLCGFQHPEYMHVVFKRFYGITPGQYRRNTLGLTD
ncbi:MAG: XylR family transcriptional regulator [Planctomycetaceae bacterium]